MRPTLQLTIIPDKHSDWCEVILRIEITSDDNVEHDVVLYNQLRQVTTLRSDQGIELWALATLGDTSNAVEQALLNAIGRGSLTLMGIEAEHNNSLF